MTLRDRARGWLSDACHLRFRELLLHSAARYHAVCPVYCLMPDHFHLLLLGWRDDSDQLKLTRHFRRHLNAALREISSSSASEKSKPFQLQKQAYDSVLRDKDRARNAFEKVAFYIAENPVRAKLVSDPSEWTFTGAVIPGYPELEWGRSDYWDRFWRLHYSRIPEGLQPPIDSRR
ncbi:MAG: hypothetical protein KDA85_16735 [Planctomycetaceae bacterium]|nr:hypothetical protein [Planctomycetaceae bacterium]